MPADAPDVSSVPDFAPEMDVPLLGPVNCEQIRVLAAEQRTLGTCSPPHANDTELVEGSKCSVRIQVLPSRCGGMNGDRRI